MGLQHSELTLFSYKRQNIGSLRKNNNSIPDFQPAKYLEIIVDCHLKWDLKIKYIVGQIRVFISRFKYLKEDLNIKQLMIYYYCIPL